MPNNVVMRRIEVGEAYRPLSVHPLVVSVEIGAPPTNAEAVTFQGDDGGEVGWLAGEVHFFKSVDLSRIFVKGRPGDVVTVIGGTWRE